MIGLSGQTIFHNPNKNYSLQIGSGKDIYNEIKVPVICNFRKNDLINGGQGAPIGSFYHKSILDKINKKACIINLGGVANITYANKKSEKQMLIATTGKEELAPKKIISSKQLITAQNLIKSIPVGDQVVESILDLVTNARPETSKLKIVKNNLSWGPGPRASQSMMLACRARAVMQGRLTPSIDDVIALAEPILKHRMNLNYSARADGNSLSKVLSELVRTLK